MKNKREISESTFRISIAVFFILCVALVYFAAVKERYVFREDSRDTITFNNEFCTNKLTELKQEVDYFDESIQTEQNLADSSIAKDINNIVKIEKRDKTMAQKEFDNYFDMCIEFEKNPTEELCNLFIEDAKLELDAALNKSASSDEILSSVFQKDLRKAKRIYFGLLEKCSKI